MAIIIAGALTGAALLMRGIGGQRHGAMLAWGVIDREGADIYVWDGSRTATVSRNLSPAYTPAWSADGWLAWVSIQDGTEQIYVWDWTRVIKVSQNIGA